MTYALVQAVGGTTPSAWRGLREALRIGIGVFIATGAILTVERLSSATLPPTYMGLLALKVGLGIWMFAQARSLGQPLPEPRPAWWRRPESRVLALGVVIWALAIALKEIYENTIRFPG